MRLSAEAYERVVGTLKSDSKRDKDGRLEPRAGLSGEATLVTVDTMGRRVAGVVRIRDVSRSGLGLIFNQQINAGQHFVLQLQYEDERPLWLVCSATHSRAIEGGRYVIGAKLKQQLREDQIPKHDKKAETAAAATKIAMKASTATPLKESDVDRISKAILG